MKTMVKAIFAVFLLVFPVAGAMAQNAGRDAAVISFDRDAYDFGAVPSGRKLTTTYTLTNKGSSPLVLTNVSSSCGCIRVDWPQTPIKPGKSGVVTVVLNTDAVVGKIQKSVTVTSNALSSSVVLTVRADVQSAAQPR